MLRDRVALVTGAGTGIGRGVARALARNGASVVIAEIDAEAGTRVAGELGALGGQGHFVHTDVSIKAQVQAAVASAVDRFGGLDIMVNNAIKVPHDALIEGKTDEMLEEQLAIGVWGCWWAMRAALPLPKQSAAGRVINFTSGDVQTGAWLHSDYNISKAGIEALTRSAAAEWSRFNILVNAISPVSDSSAFEAICAARPGFQQRAEAANPLGRIGDPETDIGSVAVFLETPLAAYVTGAIIPVDGGMHLSRASAKPAGRLVAVRQRRCVKFGSQDRKDERLDRFATDGDRVALPAAGIRILLSPGHAQL